jgi:hypothetical protein
VKVIINELEYPLVWPGDWTFREAGTVHRLTSIAGQPLLPGDVFVGLLKQDPFACLAMAVVGHMREKQDVPPDFLLDLEITRVVVDLGDEEETDTGPPAGRGGRGTRRAAKSPQQT